MVTGPVAADFVGEVPSDPRALRHVLHVAARGRRGQHLVRVGQAGGVERASQASLRVEVDRR